MTDDDDGVEPVDYQEQDPVVLTQRPLPQRRVKMVNHKGSELCTKHIEIALKRALLETEREVLFLAERGVNETPIAV